jgi:outer membrane receptor protein involved in Fe transport
MVVCEVDSTKSEQQHRARGVSAYVAKTLVVDGRWDATLGVRQNRPRAWTEDEVASIQATAKHILGPLRRQDGR